MPAEDATGVAPGANVSALFSEAMRATFVKSALKLNKKGSNNAIRATVTYYSANQKAELDPTATLEPGATYKAVVDVGASGVAGNALDQDPSVTGNQKKVWSFTIRSGGGPRS